MKTRMLVVVAVMSLTLPAIAAYPAHAAGTATATTKPATNVTSGTARLNGTVNPNSVATTYQFEYGTTTSYGNVAPATPGVVGSDATDHDVSEDITDLTPSTTYHFRVNAIDASGTTNGNDLTFVTTPLPTVRTDPAFVDSNELLARGIVNPRGGETSFYFEAGPDTTYGTSTESLSAGAGNSPVLVGGLFEGTQQGALYHYRLVATSGGHTVYGADRKVVTCGPCGDFTIDGRPDILWHNTHTGQPQLWFMNGPHVLSTANIDHVSGYPPSYWVPVAKVDYNFDGVADILWHSNSDGRNVVWFMNGPHFVRKIDLHLDAGAPQVAPSTGWTPVATADINGDFVPDILWHNTRDGRSVVWYMGLASVPGNLKYMESRPVTGGNPPLAWVPVDAADFDGDGIADILWHNTSTGRSIIWFMGFDANDNPGPFAKKYLSIAPSTVWEPTSTPDFNTDTYPDILWHNRSNGKTLIWFMTGDDGSTVNNQSYLDLGHGRGWPSTAWTPL